MTPLLVGAVLAVAAVLALLGVVACLRGRAPGLPTLGVAAALWVVLGAQAVLAGVRVTDADLPDTATFVGYLVGVLLVPPMAGAWAVVERSRWSSAVMACAALVVAVMTVRLDQLWSAGG